MTQQESKDLAKKEARAAATLEMGSRRWVLAACAALYFFAMFLPFAADASGWDMLASTQAAQDAQTKITEYVFVWCSFIGLGVLTSLTVIFRRFALGVPAWMVTTVSFAVSLMAIWLRRSSSAYDLGLRHGPGIYLAILAVAVAVFTLFPALFGRSEQARQAAQQRARAQGSDEVALAQRSATSRVEGNPLLIDDRRARAAERHKRASE